MYPQTTNPHVTTGDGIAMAYRAKAVMADMEFIQVRFGMHTGSCGQSVLNLISCNLCALT